MKEEAQTRPSRWPQETVQQCGLTTTMEAEPESSYGCSECICPARSQTVQGKRLYLPTHLNIKSRREGLHSKAFPSRAILRHDISFNPNLILHSIRFLLAMKFFKHIILGIPLSFGSHDASCLSPDSLENRT